MFFVLTFLSVTIVPIKRGAEFDFEIASWLLPNVVTMELAKLCALHAFVLHMHHTLRLLVPQRVSCFACSRVPRALCPMCSTYSSDSRDLCYTCKPSSLMCFFPCVFGALRPLVSLVVLAVRAVMSHLTRALRALLLHMHQALHALLSNLPRTSCALCSTCIRTSHSLADYASLLSRALYPLFVNITFSAFVFLIYF